MPNPENRNLYGFDFGGRPRQPTGVPQLQAQQGASRAPAMPGQVPQQQQQGGAMTPPPAPPLPTFGGFGGKPPPGQAAGAFSNTQTGVPGTTRAAPPNNSAAFGGGLPMRGGLQPGAAAGAVRGGLPMPGVTNATATSVGATAGGAGSGATGSGTGGGGSTTTTQAAPDPLQNELDQLYQDIYNQHQQSWAGTEQMINAQTQMNQRRAAEVNALMGRSIGGGFGGIMAQAQLNGQQQMLGARQQWEDRGRQLQLGELDRKLQEKHRLEDLERDAAGHTGTKEDPMPSSSAPPGAIGTGDRWSGISADGQTVTILGTDGKYYTMSADEYKQKSGKDPRTGQASNDSGLQWGPTQQTKGSSGGTGYWPWSA